MFLNFPYRVNFLWVFNHFRFCWKGTSYYIPYLKNILTFFTSKRNSRYGIGPRIIITFILCWRYDHVLIVKTVLQLYHASFSYNHGPYKKPRSGSLLFLSFVNNLNLCVYKLVCFAHFLIMWYNNEPILRGELGTVNGSNLGQPDKTWDSKSTTILPNL